MFQNNYVSIQSYKLQHYIGIYDRYAWHFKTGASSPWPPKLDNPWNVAFFRCVWRYFWKTTTDVGLSWKLSGNLWPHLTFYFQAGRLKEPLAAPVKKSATCHGWHAEARFEVHVGKDGGDKCWEANCNAKESIWDWWRVSAQHFIVWKCNSRCSGSLQILIAKFALRLPHPSFLAAHQGDAGATTA